MRLSLCVCVCVLLSAFTAYNIYLPLPSSLSEPWKLMVLDAVLRPVVKLGLLLHELGLSHHTRILSVGVQCLELQEPRSSQAVRVSDTGFSAIPVRVFESTAGQAGQLKRGVVFLHGGGWALGSGKMRTYDTLCRRMAEHLNAVVISVDYRLAPEVHFPQQYYDSMLACQHFLQPRVLSRYSVDPARVCVSGDSSGGNLAAAVVNKMATNHSFPIKFKLQVLIYPALQALDFNTPSYQQNQDVPILYRPFMARFWLEYLDGDLDLVQPLLANSHAPPARAELNWTRLLPPTFRKQYQPVRPTQHLPGLIRDLPALLDPRAAPLLEETPVLSHVPPTFILTCEHDVLRDDGLMYAQRLQEAGVPVSHLNIEDGFHGCVSFAFWPTYFLAGQRALDGVLRWMDENL